MVSARVGNVARNGRIRCFQYKNADRFPINRSSAFYDIQFLLLPIAEALPTYTNFNVVADQGEYLISTNVTTYAKVRPEGLWWYDSDNNLLVCHTADLKTAYSDLNCRGIFDTIATGKDKPDHNCFAYPEAYPEGAWIVRRFNQGVSEANTWFQDSSGWTTCYFNKEPTLSTAARAFDGIEDEKGNYFFNEAETASTAAEKLGANLNLPPWTCNRKAEITQHKDGKRGKDVPAGTHQKSQGIKKPISPPYRLTRWFFLSLETLRYVHPGQ